MCVSVVRNGRNYGLAYGALVGQFVLKVLVVGSLLIGAWNNVGTCYIPDPYK